MSEKRTLVVGGDGRAHTFISKLAQSQGVKLYCEPGNAGTRKLALSRGIAVNNITGLLSLVEEENIDLTVVSPEGPLALGIADEFKRKRRKIVAPSLVAGKLEFSKIYAKEVLNKAEVLASPYKPYGSVAEIEYDYLRRDTFPFGYPAVIKVDGLAEGKGVEVCRTLAEATAFLDVIKSGKFGSAARRILIEKFIEGEEASFICLVDVKGNILSLPSSQDHKAIYDGDIGPNTGGMGAYSWAPVITPEMYQYIVNHMVRPVVEYMRLIGKPFVGFLYFGLMINKAGIWVLEINVRMGDPEDKPILLRLKSEFLTLLEATVEGSLDKVRPVWDSRPALCVVMVSDGYPDSKKYLKGFPIYGLDVAEALPDTLISHAGTAIKDGQVITAGGRVLGVTALGDDFRKAQTNAYRAVSRINFKDKYCRTDIGHRAIAKPEQK